MTDRVKNKLLQVMVRNLRAFAYEADNYGISEEEQAEQFALADRLENGTADEEDWLEAISVLDFFG